MKFQPPGTIWSGTEALGEEKSGGIFTTEKFRRKILGVVM